MFKFQPIRIGKMKYTLYNTCAFDSIFQVMLVAACDWPCVKQIILQLQSRIPIFEMIKTVLKGGIKSSTHVKRGKILKDVTSEINEKGIRKTAENHFTIDCEISATRLAEKIFTDLPKFTITSKCSEGCNKPISKERRNFFSYPREVVIGQTLSQYLFQTKLKKCSTNGCLGSVTKTFTSSGKYFYYTFYDSILTFFKLKTLKSNFN